MSDVPFMDSLRNMHAKQIDAKIGVGQTSKGAPSSFFRPYELFVPMNRRTDVVERQVRTLLADVGRIDLDAVEDFLKSLLAGLKKLDRRGPA